MAALKPDGENMRLTRRLRRLRTRAFLLWEMFGGQIILAIAASGVSTIAFTDYIRDDTAIPFLTSLLQLAVAAALFWQRLQRA